MGMGEPLLNYSNVHSVERITSKNGLGMSPKESQLVLLEFKKNNKTSRRWYKI